MNNDRRIFLNYVAGAAASACLGASHASVSSSGTEIEQISGLAFATTWRLLYAKKVGAPPARPIIMQLINDIDKTISPFRKESLISQFNRSSVGTSTVFPKEIAALIRTSIRVANASHGAFDPTVGPIVNRFGFGPIKGSFDCTYSDLQLSGFALDKQRTGLTLDLCGLGKGFAVEKIASALKLNGYSHFLFELGGEIAAVGQHPSGRRWHVAIEPTIEQLSPATVLSLDNMCLATSGLQHNHFVFNREQYGHLINAQTKSTALPQCHSVSVLHASATLADAWSTALFVAGPVTGLQLAQANSLSAYFLFNSDEQTHPVATGQFTKSIIRN